MNKDNSNKATAGSESKKSMKAQLDYLKTVGLIQEYKAKKYGYARKNQDQFKCDYCIVMENGEKWIVFTPASLSTDRVKTKQWDAFHIKKIDKKVTKAFIVCPDTIVDRPSQKAYNDLKRYRGYILDGGWKTSVDDILLQSEFINMIENNNLGVKAAGKKSAKKGFNFEEQLKGIMSNKQNLERWKGNKLAAGWNYAIFSLVVEKLELKPNSVVSIEGDTDIDFLPTYTYKDGTTKKGGPPKTDLIIRVTYKKKKTDEFYISCKSSSKKTVGVHQFPPKYAVEILEMKEKESEKLLDDYVKAGGPKNFEKSKADLLERRLTSYRDALAIWALHGSDKDGSQKYQRADYIITRYMPAKGKKPFISIETIEECIRRQRNLNKGHFGTDFSWTVTSKDKDGKNFPSLRIQIDSE